MALMPSVGSVMVQLGGRGTQKLSSDAAGWLQRAPRSLDRQDGDRRGRELLDRCSTNGCIRGEKFHEVGKARVVPRRGTPS